MRHFAITILMLAAALVLSGRAACAQGSYSGTQPRARVIIDNDFGGDPDGLFHLAHHLMSPSNEVRAIICSHHYTDFYGWPGDAAHARREVLDLLEAMRYDGKAPVLLGAEGRLSDRSAALESEGARAIVAEAMRDDTGLPLYVLVGGGLTNIASAYLMEPRIAERITLVWIGGPEYPELCAAHRIQTGLEYNLGIDPVAAQVIFNDSDIPMWQSARDAYRQVLCSNAFINTRIRNSSNTGSYLADKLGELFRRAGGTLGEAYDLGDSPLLLVTALQSTWEPDASTSDYVMMHCPDLNSCGIYEANPDGRMIRVYTRLDSHLIFEDMLAKFSNWYDREDTD